MAAKITGTAFFTREGSLPIHWTSSAEQPKVNPCEDQEVHQTSMVELADFTSSNTKQSVSTVSLADAITTLL